MLLIVVIIIIQTANMEFDFHKIRAESNAMHLSLYGSLLLACFGQHRLSDPNI